MLYIYISPTSSFSISTTKEHFMATNSHHNKILLNSWHSHFSSGIENSTSIVITPKEIQDSGPLSLEQDQVTMKYFLKFSPESKAKLINL